MHFYSSIFRSLERVKVFFTKVIDANLHCKAICSFSKRTNHTSTPWWSLPLKQKDFSSQILNIIINNVCVNMLVLFMHSQTLTLCFGLCEIWVKSAPLWCIHNLWRISEQGMWKLSFQPEQNEMGPFDEK